MTSYVSIETCFLWRKDGFSLLSLAVGLSLSKWGICPMDELKFVSESASFPLSFLLFYINFWVNTRGMYFEGVKVCCGWWGVIHWNRATVRCKQLRHIHRFVLLVLFLWMLAIRIFLLVTILAVDLFCFFTLCIQIFILLDLCDVLNLLINNSGPFKCSSKIIIGCESGT